jgi:hypothetical protein
MIDSEQMSLEANARSQYENLKAKLNSELSREELIEAEGKANSMAIEELFEMILDARR